MVCIKNDGLSSRVSYLGYSKNFFINFQFLNMLWKVEITKSERVLLLFLRVHKPLNI